MKRSEDHVFPNPANSSLRSGPVSSYSLPEFIDFCLEYPGEKSVLIAILILLLN